MESPFGSDLHTPTSGRVLHSLCRKKQNKTRTKQKTHGTHERQREVNALPQRRVETCFHQDVGRHRESACIDKFLSINRSRQHPGCVWVQQWYGGKLQTGSYKIHWNMKEQIVLDVYCECYTLSLVLDTRGHHWVLGLAAQMRLVIWLSQTLQTIVLGLCCFPVLDTNTEATSLLAIQNLLSLHIRDVYSYRSNQWRRVVL